MKPETVMSRRDCIVWLARAAAIPLAAHACIFAHADGAAPNLTALRNDSARLLDKPEAILTRTRDGVAGLSTVCTHRRNKLEIGKDGEITCPVHDSVFDLARSGHRPARATKPLTLVSHSNQRSTHDITIDPSQTVQTGSWAPLPDWAKPKKK